MCTGVEIALVAAAVVGTAVSVAGTLSAAEDAEDASHRAAEQAEADAAAARGQAMVEARKIREATKRARSNAVAALAASGVDVSSGTAEQIQTDITQRGEEDALTTIKTGSNRGRFLLAEADDFRMRGRQAVSAGYYQAGGTVLSSVASSARGWKGSNTDGGENWDLSRTNRGSGD